MKIPLVKQRQTAQFIIGAILISLCLSACGGNSLPRPAAPTDVRATASGSSIVITWRDQSASETGFRIYREELGPLSNLRTTAAQAIDELPANANTYTDESASADIAYRYAVAAFNSAGESERSEAAGEVGIANKPPTIGALSLEASLLEVTLSVSANDAEGSVASLSIDWGDGQSESVPGGDGTVNIERSHSYAAKGNFQITVTATDDRGLSSERSEALEVSDFPTESLIAEFLTDERPENNFRVIVDSSGQGNDGYLPTSNSAEVDSATDRFGFAEKAFDFRGSDAGQKSIMEIRSGAEDGAIDYGDTLSLVVWANSGGGDRFLIGPKVATSIFNSPGLNGSAEFEVPLANSGEGYTLENPVETDGPWRFYVIIIQRSGADVNLKLYVNGDLANEGSLNDPGAAAIPTSSSIMVGARATYTNSTAGSDDYQGLLDDIRVYDRILSAAEVKALYQENGWTGNPEN